MKKIVVAACIAHPDDEAFGPSGTIAKFAKQKHDVYILCATKGEAGENRHPTDKSPLRTIREKELLESAKILGVKKVFFLGFTDGTLNNNIYHEVAGKIQTILEDIKPNLVITSEPLGVSGHLDHIAISMITTYVFFHLPFVKTLLYHCVTAEWIKKMTEIYGEYFIYRPPGYKMSEIDKIIDVSSVWDTKIRAIKAHVSQKKDVDKILHMYSLFPKKEYFLLLKKDS